MQEDTKTGVIKTVVFDRETGAFKGFGFITLEGADEDAKDIFVHHSECDFDLAEAKGKKVTFSIEEGDKGPKAVGVKLADGSDEELADDEGEEEQELAA